MKKLPLLLLIALVPSLINLSLLAQEKPIEFMIRADDSGMSHSTNTALEELAATGIPFSTSVMFSCPWYQETVQILKSNPHISVGIHLTLNAEWKNYRWSPVAGASNVPTLVDSLGFFTPSRAALRALNPSLDEIEIELRAQIERALSSGIRIDYVDYHMGAAVESTERRAIVEKLAKEYGLAISRYFGEVDVESMYSKPIDQKKDHLIDLLPTLQNSQINLLVAHIIHDNAESEALKDMNPSGPAFMSKHRQAELDALKSADFKKTLEENNIKLLTYKDLIDRFGLDAMQSPVGTGY